MSETRIGYIDAAKGIGIIAIVLGHTLPFSWLHTIVHAFHVPLFFFLSGLFLRADQALGDFFRKKFRGLMLPYYFGAVLSILAYTVLGTLAADALDVSRDGMSFSLWKNLLGMLWANTETDLMRWNTPLWFLPCLFSTSVLVYGIEKYLVRGRSVLRIPACVLCMALGFLTDSWLPEIVLPMELHVSFHMVLWMEAGLSVPLSLLRTTGKRWMLPVGAAAMLPASVLALCNTVSVKVMSGSYGCNPLYLVTAALFIGAILCISAGIPRGSAIHFLGRHTMIILLFHKFPILFLETLFPGIKPAIYSGHPLALIYVPVLVLFSVVSCLIAEQCLKWLQNKMARAG